MSVSGKRPGRPPKSLDGAKRDSLTMRVHERTRAALKEAGQANGRSLSEEAEHRIEQSFRDDRVMAALERIEAKMQPEQAQGLLTKRLKLRLIEKQTASITAAQRATAEAVQAIRRDLSSQR